MMRFTRATNALFAGALFLPTVGLFTALQASNSSRTDARHEAENARKAAEAANSINLQLQQRLTCRGKLAETLDVQVASILLKVTAGSPVDLSENREALQAAMDARAQTTDRCG